MTKKVIGTCDCFLDLWIGLSYSLFDYHDFRRRCYDVCEKICFICEARDSEHLGKKNCYNCSFLFILCKIFGKSVWCPRNERKNFNWLSPQKFTF